MALASTLIASLTLAAIFNSATSVLASTPRAPTARPSVSSRPPSASGLTLVSIRTPPNDSAISLPGSINTTGIALTPPSHRPQPKTTHLPFWSRWQQPLDTPHLAAEVRFDNQQLFMKPVLLLVREQSCIGTCKTG